MKKPPTDYERFCNYPFMQLLLQPTGNLSPCCWNQSLVLGNIQDQTVEQTWNGEKLRALREEFLAGKPVSCQTQMRHIGCHRLSRREAAIENAIEYATVQSSGPRRLDLRLNGKCNLECVMCEVWQQPNGLYDERAFWEYARREIFPRALEMDVLGGEPFIQKDTFRLIDEIVAVNPACTWAFVTNGQYELGPAIRARLDRIRIRWLQVSIDSVDPQTYASIRKGGKLERVLRTLQDYIDYRDRRAEGDRFNLSVSMCVQKDNWREAGAFIDFARQQGLPFALQFAYRPESSSLLNLPTAERMEAREYFDQLKGECETAEITDAIGLDAICLPLSESAPT